MTQVRHFRDVRNQMEAEGVSMRLAIGPDDGAPFFNMRVFEVQPGYSTPRHSHWWEHEVFVVSGEGVVLAEQEERSIGPGDVIFVPGGETHFFRNTGDQLLCFVCIVPQEWLDTIDRPRAGSS